MSTTNQVTKDNLNGVDVGQLHQTVELIRAQPELATFRFRFDNRWSAGPRSTSTVESFHGAGQDHRHATPFTLTIDEPPVLLGTDRHPNPGEYLLHALAGCLTSAIVYHAAARGIAIEAIESTIEGDVDLRGFLGLDPNVRSGFEQIRIGFRIKADLPDEQLKELCDLGPRFSPMFDSITKGVPVDVRAERLA